MGSNKSKGGVGQIPISRQSLDDCQRLNWLRLIRSENVGPVTFRDLVNHFGGAQAALEALPELSRQGGRGRPIRVPSQEEAEAEIAAAHRTGARLVAMGELGYPQWLCTIQAPPPVIYIKGRPELADQPIIAIVGARNGSAIGQKFTRLIAAGLGREGYAIASGLARGIDTAAHTASLENGTIAVLAGGIDITYPQENAALHAQIGEQGLLVSERPPGLQPRGQDFPRRNRIISGMSAGVVVIEAAKKSGSLITARFAADQGREVFAVPGNPLDPRATGTNELIKDGAHIVTSPEDIIEALEPVLGRSQSYTQNSFDEYEYDDDSDVTYPPDIDQTDRQRVIEALSPAPTDIDEIIRNTTLPARTVQIILLELDLAGRLERHGLQLVSLNGEEGSILGKLCS